MGSVILNSFINILTNFTRFFQSQINLDGLVSENTRKWVKASSGVRCSIQKACSVLTSSTNTNTLIFCRAGGSSRDGCVIWEDLWRQTVESHRCYFVYIIASNWHIHWQVSIPSFFSWNNNPQLISTIIIRNLFPFIIPSCDIMCTLGTPSKTTSSGLFPLPLADCPAVSFRFVYLHNK